MSSTLYVSGIAIIFAGAYAPLVLLAIALVLFFYKAVYTEVVEALPVNGGAYNCLLNGTSKTIAAIAGIMNFLSYIATAVLSAKVGIGYLHTIAPMVPVILGTILLLLFFLLLVLSGIKHAAKIALVIFIFHIITLTTLAIVGTIFFLNGHSYFMENVAYTKTMMEGHGGLWIGLYLAFSASLLGVSGFESSANFVEEQGKGVFRKTLRNMLIGVAIFNPLMALVVLNSLPFEAIVNAKDFLLADAGLQMGGEFLKYMVAIDAALVLSGAVLTSYVGVSGLLSRMTLDNCLPSYFGKMNKHGAYPRILIAFFLLCGAILLVTKGNLLSLAGIYTIAFLGVMTLFGIGNLILRQTRTDLQRPYKAPLLFVGLASVATLFGIIGNIRIDQENLQFFELYFIPAVIIVLIMVYQDHITKALVRITEQYTWLHGIHRWLLKHFKDQSEGNLVIFIHHAARLHAVLDYINRNETSENITIVHCNDPRDILQLEFKKIQNILPLLKEVGMFSHFTYRLEYVEQEFSAQAIDAVVRDLKINKNRVMIGAIRDFKRFNYDELRGVRVII